MQQQENGTFLQERTIGGLHEFLAKNLPALPAEAAILDVGCGTGAWLNRLKTLGFTSLHGVDLDTNQFKLEAVESKKVNLGWEKLPFADNTFDFITVKCFNTNFKTHNPLFGKIFRRFLPKPVPGDTICLSIKNVCQMDNKAC